MKLEVINGCFGYEHEPQILKDISFQIEKGEVLAILGPNGAGKTTLLRCLLGFLRFTSGTVKIDDKVFTDWKNREFWKRTAYVPQAKTMTFAYQTEETVLLGRNPYLSLFQQPSAKDRQIAEQAMEECGISHLKGKRCDQISGGELQLVLIARALAQQPELLIMDEPETGLDFRNQLLVLELIEKLSHQNKFSVIFNTHYPEHAMRIADRTLLIGKTGSGQAGKTADILTEQNMREVFDVDIHTFTEVIGGKTYAAMIPLSPERKDI